MRFEDNNIAEQIYNEILRHLMEKELAGGAIQYTYSINIKTKANKSKKRRAIFRRNIAGISERTE